jgi:hypothetical protein
MTKPNLRHHGAHPSTAVKPNLSINKKPEAYVAPEKAAMPNANPSVTTPVDCANARLGALQFEEPDPVDPDDVNPDDETEDEDRLGTAVKKLN